MSKEVMPPVKLIVGLGNIGQAYVDTRHNVGFMFTDEVLIKFGGFFHDNKRYFGQTATTRIAGRDVMVLQPSTLMNLSGKAVSALATFYKYKPEEILVVHDELDLPPGVVKYKIGGGCAGHNGLKSIASVLGSQNFQRLRLGIGHPRDKQLQTPVADYVLSRPSRDDRILISQAIAKGIEYLPLIIEGDTQKALQDINT